MNLLVKGTSGPLTGQVQVPNSKYHAHRALILASLAPGTSRILGLSDARHVQYTMDVLRALGTKIEVDDQTLLVTGWPVPREAQGRLGRQLGIDALLHDRLGVARRRADHAERAKVFPPPAGRTVARSARCRWACGSNRRTGARRSQSRRAARGAAGSSYPERLSQWISGLLLLAPFASERTVIEVEGELNERPYIALTAEMMRAFDLHVHIAPDWRRFEIEPGQQARPATVELPPDIGSAAFGLAVTAIHPSDVLFRGLQKMPGELPDHPEGAFMEIVARNGRADDLRRARASRAREARRQSSCAACASTAATSPICCRFFRRSARSQKARPCWRIFGTCVSRNRIASPRCCSSTAWADTSNCTTIVSSRTASRSCSARISRRLTITAS